MCSTLLITIEAIKMIKHILVCLNNTKDDDNTIKTAARFALKHNARLIGLYIMVESLNHYHVYDHYTAGLRKQIIDEGKQQAVLAEKKFNEVTSKIGCNTTWYKASDQENPTQIMLYTDLIFVGCNEKDGGDFNGSGFINSLLLETGRPIVVIPKIWKKDDFGQKILLGWNESKQSARAMHESLPLMRGAEQVDVVTVYRENDQKANMAKGIEVTSFLESHDVNCQLYPKQINENQPTVGKMLVTHADQYENDLIVVGGYGHSYLREKLLGGVTQHLIHNSRVPLLLVH